MFHSVFSTLWQEAFPTGCKTIKGGHGKQECPTHVDFVVHWHGVISLSWLRDCFIYSDWLLWSISPCRLQNMLMAHAVIGLCWLWSSILTRHSPRGVPVESRSVPFLSRYLELEKCNLSTQTNYIEKGTCIYFIHFIYIKQIDRKTKQMF